MNQEWSELNKTMQAQLKKEATFSDGITTLLTLRQKLMDELLSMKNESFSDVYFVTSKRSKLNGKATHFENNPKASVCYFSGGDSVTLIGNVEFIEDRAMQEAIWNESDRRFFSRGIDDPKFRLLHFHTIETTFWIEGKFRTCKYK